MKCMHKFFSCGAVAACAFALFACGDDVITQNTVRGFERVDEVSEVACNAENEGKLVYETSSKTSYICSDKEWVDLDAVKSAASYCYTRTLKDESGVEIVCDDSVVGSLSNGVAGVGESKYSCKPKVSSDGKKIEVVCGGKTIGVLENGDDGKGCSVKDTTETSGKKRKGLVVSCADGSSGVVWNGEDGESGGEGCYVDSRNAIVCADKTVGTIKNGNDGACCTVKEVTDEKTGATGYEMTCGSDSDKTVGTIWNGTKGLVGDGCYISSEEGLLVRMVCGVGENETEVEIYKAMCGDNPYDSEQQFCFDNEVQDLCDGQKYNPYGQYCKKNGSMDGTRDSVWDHMAIR